jgi:hypothetical protein
MKKLAFTALAFTFMICLFQVQAGKQRPALTSLYSSERVFNDTPSVFIKDVTGRRFQDDQLFYVLMTNRQVAVYDSQDRLMRTVPTFMNFPDSIAVDSEGHIYIADSSANQIRKFSPNGKMLKTFPVHQPISFAVLDNGNIVVASPSKDLLLRMYDPSGRELKSFGSIKQFVANNEKQNNFLNRGKVLVDSSGTIYYVYKYAPAPIIQRFSKKGNLLSEFTVAGSAIDLQLEVIQQFLRNRAADTIGGINTINSAGIDFDTDHIWVCMNGSSDSGVVYEYNSGGKKLQEYRFIVNTRSSSSAVSGVSQIVLRAPSIYVVVSPGAFRFDLNNDTPVNGNPIQTAATCPVAVEFNDCKAPCATTETADDKDCKAELLASVSMSGRRIVSSVCNSDPNTCTAQITLCRESNGAQTNHNITLNCGNGGGGGGCEYSICSSFDPEAPPPDVCCFSPILIDVSGNGFDLTDNSGGVAFDLNNDGVADQLSWTAAGSDDAWLALDRNQNGTIDNGSELFGNFTPQPHSPNANGFLALAEYDKPGNGGNGDSVIDGRDAIFSSLRLWRDTSHNGISEPGELYTLPLLGLASIDLDYKESKRTDQYGNKFRYRAKVKDARGTNLGRWAWDIFLASS